MKFNYKKFRKKLVSRLKKLPQNYGDVSDIVNEAIDGDINVKLQVQRELYHLKRINIIEIKDLPNDPMQMQDDWWGNFLGHNPTAGYKVEGLTAALTKEYIDKPWKDRYWVWWEIIKMFGSAIVGGLVGFLIGLASAKTNSGQNSLEKNKSVDTIYLTKPAKIDTAK